MLKSIVALLLALADLADRAALKSSAVSTVMFLIVSRAEQFAWAYSGCRPGARPADFARSGNVESDTICLARRLRELARLLTIELWQPLRYRPDASIPPASMRDIACPQRAFAMPALGYAYPDTS